MYTALLFGLLGIAAFLFITGSQKKQTIKVYSGLAVAVLTLFFFWFMGFWGEALWFANLGYGSRFWTIVYSNGGFAIAGAALGFILIYLLTFTIPKEHKIILGGSKILAVLIGGVWGISNWDVILKFWDRVNTGITDPILGKDVGFYLFTLPFLDNVYILLIIISIVALGGSVFSSLFRFTGENLVLYFPTPEEIRTDRFYFPLYLNSAVFIFILALQRFLDRYHLMYSTTGVTSGPSWTDVNVLLPAYSIVIILMVLIGLALIIPSIRKKLQNFFYRKFHIYPERSHIMVLASAGVTIVALWLLAFTAIPGLFQLLLVQPNEITFEKPYISNNIKFTRYAFDLNRIKEKQYPMNGSFTPDVVNNYPGIFTNIRLWDWRALDAVYKQFQAFRLYYEFSDVDVDRYYVNGQYKQVMVSAREINIDNLPAQSQTFVNKRFQYTHGFGLTMAEVNEFTPQGLPHLLIQNIPPVSESPNLNVTQPQIYYGELTNAPVVVNSKQKEFDYPSGEDNVYTRYTGKGGVRISNFWRKFLFGWKFDGTSFLFSDYPTDSSRIMFHRQIEERVRLLAPFLKFDQDPYLVLADGKLYWMIDAYTTSGYYPYSQPLATENDINYIRNSVKVTVNAYNGAVNFYIMDEKDPIIKVWDKIFPGLFKTKEEMPRDLLAHIRYPSDLLLIQGTVYEKYHMTDPTVFYNQEDLWVRATEEYYGHTQHVEPYYIMWQLPGTNKPQFVLMLPFTPKNRQVLIGWIAAMCDPGDYGNILAYQFPKDKTILGPQQVETKIDQDSYLSGQLTLWDQHGSNVIRGNVLAIPVNNTLFYVEPIYLKAQTAAYPEMRLVVVMHGDNMSYAKTFDQALSNLFTNAPSSQNIAQQENVSTQQAQNINQPPVVTGQTSMQDQIRNANDAFNNYLRYLGDKKFDQASKELEKLQQSLQTLSNQSAGKK